MTILLFSLLGALINRIRGGFATDLYAEYLVSKGLTFKKAIEEAEKTVKTASKHLNHLVFAVAFATLFLCSGYYHTFWTLILLSLGMLSGSSFGWGNYIEAMISNKVDYDRTDAPVSDWVFFKLAHKPILAGCFALSVRGLLWTSCLGIALTILSEIGCIFDTNAFYIIPMGLLMGMVYLVCIELCGLFSEVGRGRGWQVGELAWGAILWGSLAYFLGA